MLPNLRFSRIALRVWILIAAGLAGSLLPGQDVVVEVNAAKVANYKIPRTIYGTFLEPIGNSVYGGLWAQILENPSFEDNLWNATQLRRKVDANAAFYRSTELGLPLPWEPLDATQGARYEPRWNDAANSYRSMMIMAVSDGETGVRQTVYLPLHRTRGYRGSLYTKHLSGPAEVTVSFRERNRRDIIYIGAKITPSSEWSRSEFSLRLDPSQGASLEPLDFVISASNGTRILVDQVMLWPDDAVQGMDPEMISMSRDLKTPLVRYGGNFTSAYHWKDGIGPIDKRISMLNIAWGMPEYNHFGTDEFLAFCHLIEADPQIALNLGTGTPQEAAEWVKYVDSKWNNGQGGLVWELGNELWGDFQTGYPAISHIAEHTHDFAVAIRAVDAKAKLIATGQDPDHFDKWNSEQLKNAKLIDYLSTHFVVGSSEVKTNSASPDFIAAAALALPVELERRLRAMHSQIQSVPDAADRVSIAFTEWLFWARDDGGPRFTNMAGALCTAGMLNTLIRTADITRISDMTGLIEFGGIWKKRGRVFGVPAYFAFRMYSAADATVPVESSTNGEKYSVHGGVNRLPDIADVPYLDIVAARNEASDRLTLFCVNRHLTRGFKTRIDLHGFHASGLASVQTLVADSIYQVNDEAEPEAVVPHRKTVATTPTGLTHIFPASSITVIEFHN